MYESKITYLPVAYEEAKVSPFDPIPNSLWKNENYKSRYEDLFADGWELVNVQPLLRAQYERRPQTSYGYNLTAGYYFFWKREKREPAS
jgi:hypothetical protein